MCAMQPDRLRLIIAGAVRPTVASARSDRASACDEFERWRLELLRAEHLGDGIRAAHAQRQLDRLYERLGEELGDHGPRAA
jgi:hypothetical protein